MFLQFANHGFNILLTIVLANILSPNDFGLVAMILVISEFSRIILEFGFGQALIQKQNVTNTDYDTVFWFNVISGGILTLIVAFGAHYFALFYNQPILKPLTIVLSLNYFLSSFSIVPQIILVKKIDFKTLTKIRLASVVISGLIGVILAKHYGIWALVFIEVSRTLLISLLSIIIVKEWKPKFNFRFDSLKSIFKFSINLFGNESLNYWMDNVDKLIIGRILGDYSLGIYRQAYSFMLLPVNNISRVLNSVLFPILSEKQQDKDYLSKTFEKSFSNVNLVVFPLLTLLLISSGPLVYLLLGKNWTAMITILKYFSIAGIFYSLSEITNSFFLSIGKTEVLFRTNLLIRIVLITAIVYAIKYKLEGVALAVMLISPLKLIIMLFSLNKVIKLKIKPLLKKLFQNLLISIIIVGLSFLSDLYLLIDYSNFSKLVFYIVLVVLYYLVLYYLIFRNDLKHLMYHLMQILKI